MKTNTPKFKYENVLLLDDNELDNFINQKILEAAGFAKEIHVTTSGEKALELISHALAAGPGGGIFPDMMFIDLNMPVMNGFEFIGEFKKLTIGRPKPCGIVILTSSVDTKDRARAAEIDDRIVLLNKPLTIEALNQLVFEEWPATVK